MRTVLTQFRPSFRNIAALVSAVAILTVVYVGVSSREWGSLDIGRSVGEVVLKPRPRPRPPASTSPEEWARRAEQVKEAFRYAYAGYEEYAFPHDELFPLSHGFRDNFNGWGVTVFDSLDTMLLMGLTDEFERALDHVRATNFTVVRPFSKNINLELSFFETVIRYLGGMLSAYAFSHEPILLEKAEELAGVLTPVFNTTTGLPWFGLYTLTGNIFNRSSIGMLAEVATCQLEYAYLAQLTGKKEHYDRSAKIFESLGKVNLTGPGMLPIRISLRTGYVVDDGVSVGAGADSGHEYLLKYYLMTGQKDQLSIDLYMRSMNHVLTKMLFLSPRRGLLYVTDIIGYNHKPSHRVEHLSCFLPGLLALGVHTLPSYIFDNARNSFTSDQATALASHNLTELHLGAAIGLGETCWRMYADQASGLAPESVAMISPHLEFGGKRYGVKSGLWIDALNQWREDGRKEIPGTEEKGDAETAKMDYQVVRSDYLLRPETIESMYLLWRVTGEEKWRERAWTIFTSIERSAKTQVGYTSVRNSGQVGSDKGNEMPSFFLAETLKYLYLAFVDDELVPLDRWVFNTEAHPFPIFDWSSWEKHKFGIS